MNRTLIKKIIYKTFGEGVYAKAYAKGKINDIKNGVLDEKEAQFLPHFIAESSSVLDIGANYGHYAVDMARICSKGKVYAFEPVPFTYRVLDSIISHFSLPNIQLRNAAVSNEHGTVEMTIPLLDFGAPNTGIAFVGEGGPTHSKKVSVQTIRLDDLDIKETIDFIKIDIEGHEPEAFRGMEKLIKRDLPIVLIEFSHNCLNRANTRPTDFAAYLKKELGYAFTSIQGEQLNLNKEETPSDGYYFLIPTVKMNQFKNLFQA